MFGIVNEELFKKKNKIFMMEPFFVTGIDK